MTRNPRPDPETVFEYLADDHARTILEVASDGPVSAKQLEHHCEVSLRTIYRRLDGLTEAGLLDERIRPDAGGNHYSVYDARFETLQLRVSDGRIDMTVGGQVSEDTDRPPAPAD